MADLPRDAEIETLREHLREAADALVAVGKAAIVVNPRLKEPYSDDPSTNPWKRFMETPARNAYNLGVRLRRLYRQPADGEQTPTPETTEEN